MHGFDKTIDYNKRCASQRAPSVTFFQCPPRRDHLSISKPMAAIQLPATRTTLHVHGCSSATTNATTGITSTKRAAIMLCCKPQRAGAFPHYWAQAGAAKYKGQKSRPVPTGQNWNPCTCFARGGYSTLV